MPPTRSADASDAPSHTTDSAPPTLIRKSVDLLAAPAVMGGLSGLAAAFNQPTYWSLQAICVAGALLASPYRRTWRPWAAGAAGGVAFGIALIAVLTLTTREPVLELTDPLWAHVVVTSTAGALLTPVGSLVDRRRRRRSS